MTQNDQAKRHADLLTRHEKAVDEFQDLSYAELDTWDRKDLLNELWESSYKDAHKSMTTEEIEFEIGLYKKKGEV